MMLLQVNEATKEYQGIPILTGVTFHLAAGEKVGLVGANGCGKSTLLKILAGQMPADSGTVNWLAGDVTRAYLSQERDPEPGRSGGEKTRAAITRALAGNPRLLLLDEPTNHLDTDALQWLESTLKSYRGTVLVVSHDRYFLDTAVTRILELDGGRVKEYPGNYSAYAAQKQAERQRAADEYRQYVNERKHLEAAIQRQRSWAMSVQNEKLPSELKVAKASRSAQAKAHMQVAKSMENRLERIKKEKPRDAQRINLKLEEHGKVGRNLLLAERLGFSYDGRRWLFRGADFYVQRGDRLAITGPNGAGKSTLLRLLLGELAPTEGTIYRSPVKVAYLAQELELLNPANTVLAEASGGNTAVDQAEVRTLLGCLLFQRDAVMKRVGALSGGEKVRLALAKILLSAPDLLVLDEPTNNLDLPSRERVEEALEGYPGTLLLVSHDRYLVRRLARRTFTVADGRLVCAGPAAAPPPDEDPAVRRLLLETRLARLSAELAAPPPGEAERLNAEFIQVSRELRSLRS